MSSPTFRNIKTWFLIDGAGALLSAFLLGVALPYFQELIGMPLKTLYFLAALPCLFLLYDLVAYFQPKLRQVGLLKGIAFANMGYSLVSSIAVVLHFDSLTFWGLAYFLLEILIVFGIGAFEYRVATQYPSEE